MSSRRNWPPRVSLSWRRRADDVRILISVLEMREYLEDTRRGRAVIDRAVFHAIPLASITILQYCRKLIAVQILTAHVVVNHDHVFLCLLAYLVVTHNYDWTSIRLRFDRATTIRRPTLRP